MNCVASAAAAICVVGIASRKIFQTGLQSGSHQRAVGCGRNLDELLVPWAVCLDRNKFCASAIMTLEH